jgi:hypothetical protein
MASAGQPLSIVVEDVSRTVTINLDVMQITPAKKDAGKGFHPVIMSAFHNSVNLIVVIISYSNNFGFCGHGPDFCGKDVCVNNCDRKSECDPGFGSEWAESSTCPLNVCCSEFVSRHIVGCIWVLAGTDGYSEHVGVLWNNQGICKLY